MNRRQVVRAVAVSGVTAAMGSVPAHMTASAPKASRRKSSLAVAKDGTRLFFQDWGSGQPVFFLSAWAFSSDVWGSHITTLVERGFRCIAVDRRGHGRSDVSSSGYDADTLSDDVAAVIEYLDLKNVVLVAHSMGSIEAVRYCTRHGMDRIARIVLAAPTTPYLTQTSDNIDGIPKAAIDSQNESVARDYPKWIAENEGPFFTADTIQETRNWIKHMMLSVPVPAALACRRMIATVDVRAELSRIERPMLIIHGDKDASAPLAITAEKTARLIAKSKLIVYAGAPHALILTHRDRFLADLSSFIR